MTPDERVRDLYERFPYPNNQVDLRRFKEQKSAPVWNPGDSYTLYFPRSPFRADLDILIAGCGTNIAQQHAAYLPDARIVAIDISESSIRKAKADADAHGLRNLEFHLLPIERVSELGRQFDFVNCHGVLHHLADPVAGLRALGQVTRPEGALSLMVYARYGRTGVYMLQELFRDRLGMQWGQSEVAQIQSVLPSLPEHHPLRILGTPEKMAAEAITDTLLHPRDRAYTVADVYALVAEAGLQFQRWMAQAPYTPALSALADLPAVAGLSREAGAAVMELFYGILIKHEFVVSPLGVPQVDSLFAGERLWNAVPRMSSYVEIEQEGETMALRNRCHPIPFQVNLTLNPPDELQLLRRVNGSSSIAQIVKETGGQSRLSPDEALEVFRTAWLADILDLRAG